MSELKIEYIPLSDIKPYEGNAKLHPDEQIEQIKESIQKFNFNDPIAIWGEDNTIVEGHGRYLAAKELGMDKVPVIRLDSLTDEQRRAYTLVHNKLTMNSGFDFDTLESELNGLSESDLDFDMSDFGFSDDEQEESEETHKQPDLSDSFAEHYSVIIDCKDENEQEKIYDECVQKGYECRLSTL